ncbi:MAG TPA: phosphate ABC transporter substrate-binding protein [Opitutaceae bacterium]|jgi:phosphate transport system substrate-binding protein|nr:MAG: Phosphate-binding protein PstS 1 precursor [Verrucomicrobia bacterium ADurb.Bin122]HNW40555.1 phosphate ABC transporter substrate-binding protein [Opitutaceae bacterium]HOD47760.1 phosphate ABC transporter substrate-binding protein [Opitutaceae bacterium]HOF08766.1 phosphate ABC transporter substrate-binding protein [Opitutaceae bacterium]HOR25492.1 phosphate ABC transporter substrate-binding protein [Opitutaceae bacterium]
MKKLLSILAALLCVSAAYGQKLVIKGSDTLGAKLVPQAAEAFKTTHPDVAFEIAAEGSTTGIAAITDSTAQIGMSSRRAKPVEISAALAKGVTMKPTIVAYDGMAVIVNEANPVTELTLRQVEQIFTGDVTDWTAVGGNPGKFSIYTRNTSSGTYSDWKELAMKKRDYASSSQKMAGNEQIAAEVAKNPNGIGYVGLAYTHAPGIRVVGIVGKDKIAVLPSNQTVQAKTYPYARPTFFYTNGEPSGLTAEFVDFMLGAEGQALVQKVGFVPAVQH